MDLSTDIECPNCKKKIQIKIKEMVPGRKKSCPKCRTEIKFTGDDGRKAQKALDDLEKSMKNLFLAINLMDLPGLQAFAPRLGSCTSLSKFTFNGMGIKNCFNNLETIILAIALGTGREFKTKKTK